jgi:uncharacterized membrane protein YfcA
MDILLIVGYLSALVIGISLGLIGGGGSILTVPVLVYFLGIDAITSTAYSLFIVGSTALVGAFRSYFDKQLALKIGVIFAIPSLIAVWLTRAFLIPAIPDPLFQVSDTVISKDMGILVFFAFIMILSSVSMIRKKKNKVESEESGALISNYFLIVIEGLVVGTVTGIVGAGGGFLIIPALVLLARLPMKIAVGTSLMIIAVKSLIGFTGDLMNPEMMLDWSLLLIFSFLSIVGIFIGIYFRNFISGEKLKKGFGYFLLLMGLYMIIERLSQM